MTLRDSRDLGGPQLRYSRLDDVPTEEILVKALELARKIEDLLVDTRSVAGIAEDARTQPAHAAHSTRMARAMAASLVDELEVLTRPARK